MVVALTENNLPIIDGPTEIKVIVQEEFNTFITARDDDTEDVVTITHTEIEEATFDAHTGLFAWTPQDRSEVELRWAFILKRTSF